MPLGDLTEQQALISAYYGGDTSGIPASFSAGLFTDTPANGGVELDYPGYARVTLTNNTTVFVPGTDGSATALADFPDATDAATVGDAKCWYLFNGSALNSYDFLATPLTVSGAGAVEAIEVTPYTPNATSVPA